MQLYLHFTVIYVPSKKEKCFFSYAIKIGENNNTVSTISRIGPTTKDEQFETPNVLNCEAPTTFWLTWDSRDVRFGSGLQVGGNELGRYE